MQTFGGRQQLFLAKKSFDYVVIPTADFGLKAQSHLREK